MTDATDFRIRRRDEADYVGGPVPPGMKAVVAQEVFHGHRPEPRAIDVIPEMVQQGVTPSRLEREIVDDAIVRSRVGGTVGIPVASAVVTMMSMTNADFSPRRSKACSSTTLPTGPTQLLQNFASALMFTGGPNNGPHSFRQIIEKQFP